MTPESPLSDEYIDKLFEQEWSKIKERKGWSGDQFKSHCQESFRAALRLLGEPHRNLLAGKVLYELPELKG